MVSRELVALGQEIVGKVARELATGGRRVHLQLLASRFYEAVKDELERTPRHEGPRMGRLAAAADQCRRAASCVMLAPALVAVELRAAVAMLSGDGPDLLEPPATPFRPQLRLIQGGLT
jgi:hypothetical protein